MSLVGELNTAKGGTDQYASGTPARKQQTNLRPCGREKGYLYWVLNLTDENGKRKPKWIPTHKKVKGNKTWANNMLPTIRKEWTEKLLQEATASQQSASPSGPSSAAISFVDFLYQWLEYKYKSATGRVMDSKPIELSTYSGYEQQLKIELVVLLTAFYGLRRSEVIGLKWSAFDFNHNCFSIRHTVTTCNVKGERVTIKKDKAKNKSSLRTYPLIPF